jgi:hypothetical protein
MNVQTKAVVKMEYQENPIEQSSFYKAMMEMQKQKQDFNFGDQSKIGLTPQEKANIIPDQPSNDSGIQDASKAMLANQAPRPDNSTPSIIGDAAMKGTLAGMASASPVAGAVVGGGALIQGLFAQHAAEKAAEEALAQRREDARRLALQNLESKKSDDMSSVIQDMLSSSRAALLRR